MVILEKEVLTPQQLFDRVTYSFSHKNSKVREEIMICLVNTINMWVLLYKPPLHNWTFQVFQKAPVKEPEDETCYVSKM